MAVTATNYSSTQQRISWDRPGGVYTHTQIERSTGGGAYAIVTISGQQWFSVSITAVYVTCSAGSSYRYRVRHRYKNAFGQFVYSSYSYSNTLTFQPPGGGYVPPDPNPPTPPEPSYNPPTNLKITALSDTSISLSWQNNDTYPYTVLNTYVNGAMKEARWFSGNPSSFTDTLHPAANRLIQYQLLVVFNPGPGEFYKYSNAVYIRTTPAAPPAATVEKFGSGIKVSWTRPTNWDKAWQWLDVQRWDNVSNQWATLLTGLSPNATSIEDTDIIRSRQYRYRVRARANTGSFERVSAWAYTGYIRLMAISAKIGGSWKSVEEAFVKIGGAWKPVDGVWVKIDGVWRQA